LTNPTLVAIIINSLGQHIYLLIYDRYTGWLATARKKRSTRKESDREDRPLAGRRSGKRDAEGSFGAGFLNGK
jgi:hypothetical protein